MDRQVIRRTEDGSRVEVRLAGYRRFEARELRPDGSPHDDKWYACGDYLLALARPALEAVLRDGTQHERGRN